jgi:hypothetical protein
LTSGEGFLSDLESGLSVSDFFFSETDFGFAFSNLFFVELVVSDLFSSDFSLIFSEDSGDGIEWSFSFHGSFDLGHNGHDGSLFGEPAFLQLSKHANQLLKNSVTIRQAHHMAPILAALAELGDAEL